MAQPNKKHAANIKEGARATFPSHNSKQRKRLAVNIAGNGIVNWPQTLSRERVRERVHMRIASWLYVYSRSAISTKNKSHFRGFYCQKLCWEIIRKKNTTFILRALYRRFNFHLLRNSCAACNFYCCLFTFKILQEMETSRINFLLKIILFPQPRTAVSIQTSTQNNDKNKQHETTGDAS